MNSKKNINVSILKFVAACFVVFLHVDFKGKLGVSIECLARFAVPLFFALSGYYSYRTEIGNLKKRIIKFLIILLVANILYVEWNIITNCYIGTEIVSEYLKKLFSLRRIAEFIFMEYSFTSGHLWYLSAMIYVYLILIIYSRFFDNTDSIDYKTLYIISVCCLLFQIAFGFKASFLGLGDLSKIYRNSLFFGLPMFSMGLFIRDNQERILSSYFDNKKKTVILFILCIALAELQYFELGITEMPVAIIFIVFCLVTLSTQTHKEYNSKIYKIARVLDDSSLSIYVIHGLVKEVMLTYNKQTPVFDKVIEVGIFPILVLLISIVLSFIYVFFASFFRKVK